MDDHKILLLLGEHPQLRMSEVSEFLGVASSTAHRLLAMLQYRCWLRFGTQVLLQSGTALTGGLNMQRFDFRRALTGCLERLNHDLQETVHLVMLDGATLVRLIDAIESPGPWRRIRLGRSMPASSSRPAGDARAAAQEGVRRAVSGPGTPDAHPAQPRSRSDLEKILERVRRKGYSVVE